MVKTTTVPDRRRSPPLLINESIICKGFRGSSFFNKSKNFTSDTNRQRQTKTPRHTRRNDTTAQHTLPTTHNHMKKNKRTTAQTNHTTTTNTTTTDNNKQQTTATAGLVVAKQAFENYPKEQYAPIILLSESCDAQDKSRFAAPFTVVRNMSNEFHVLCKAAADVSCY